MAPRGVYLVIQQYSRYCRKMRNLGGVVEAFPNSAQFAKTLRELRSAAAFHSASKLSEQGGPDRSYVTKIESGENMSITPATIAKLADAFAPEFGDRSGLEALGRAFFHSYADTAPKPHPESGFRQAAAASSGGLLLGFDLATDQPVIATCIEPSPDKFGRTLISAAGVETVRKVLIAIAAQSDVVTLASTQALSTGSAADMAAKAWQGRTFNFGEFVWPTSALAVDPIAHVNNLRLALKRAQILGATGTDTLLLGWAILIANAIAADSDTQPIEAVWRRESTWNVMRQRVAEHGHDSPEHVGAGGPAIPETQAIREAAQRFLLPWLHAYTAALYQVQYDITPESEGSADLMGTFTSIVPGSADSKIKWRAGRLESTTPRDLESGHLCLYNGADFGPLPKVLNALEIAKAGSTAVLDPAQLSVDSDTDPVTYYLCPLLADGPYALARRVGRHTSWQAIQYAPAAP